jgi:hypothetical protein
MSTWWRLVPTLSPQPAMLQVEPAAPYFVMSDHLMKPIRPREVICELLGVGLPVSRVAHLALNNAYDAKQFVRMAKRLLAVARNPAVLAMHVVAASQLGLLSAEGAAFATKAAEAIARAGVVHAAEALDAMVRHAALHFPQVCSCHSAGPLTAAPS